LSFAGTTFLGLLNNVIAQLKVGYTTTVDPIIIGNNKECEKGYEGTSVLKLFSFPVSLLPSYWIVRENPLKDEPIEDVGRSVSYELFYFGLVHLV